MPELPEVETLRRGLDEETTGRRITAVHVTNPKVLKGQSEADFRGRLDGFVVQSVERRGKYLLMRDAPHRPLGPSVPSRPSLRFSLCIHLKMRGQLLVASVDTPVAAYHCVTLALDDGREVRFHDMWTWGEIRALSDEELGAVRGLSGMGDEPLEPGWDAGVLAAVLARRSGPIKPTLLDQKVVAGIGNIYADESLFRAGIHPERRASSLTCDELKRLVCSVRTVLHEAIEGGGTTSEEYVNVRGVMGRFTPRVYDRGGAPCVSCGTALTRIRLGGRGTVFCAQCQC